MCTSLPTDDCEEEVKCVRCTELCIPSKLKVWMNLITAAKAKPTQDETHKWEREKSFAQSKRKVILFKLIFTTMVERWSSNKKWSTASPELCLNSNHVWLSTRFGMLWIICRFDYNMVLSKPQAREVCKQFDFF